MPIYEYTCTKCGKDFEELVFGDDLPACPHCGAAETRKLMSRCAHCSGGNGGDDSFAPSMPASSGSGNSPSRPMPRINRLNSGGASHSSAKWERNRAVPISDCPVRRDSRNPEK